MSLVKVLIVMVVSGAMSGCGALARVSQDPTTPTASRGPAPGLEGWWPTFGCIII